MVMRTRVPHCLVLLRHAASVSQHPLPCLCVSLPVARHCSGPLPSGLVTVYAAWLVFRSTFNDASAVGPERSRSSNIPTSSLRPHHWCTGQFTLVTCALAHYLQGCRPDVPCCDRRRTTVSLQFVRVADVPSRHRLRSS